MDREGVTYSFYFSYNTPEMFLKTAKPLPHVLSFAFSFISFMQTLNLGFFLFFVLPFLDNLRGKIYFSEVALSLLSRFLGVLKYVLCDFLLHKINTLEEFEFRPLTEFNSRLWACAQLWDLFRNTS